MIKTYKANTNVSINVVLPSKKNLHISFVPLSNGSSTFTTDNEDIMNAIESHYNFGKLFRLHSQQGESKKKATKVVELPKKEEKKEEHTADVNPTPTNETTVVTDNGNDETADANDGGENNEQNDETSTEGAETENGTSLKKVTVSDLAAAKDYLADKFDISRTALRSKKAIVEQAAANGIEFVGLS